MVSTTMPTEIAPSFTGDSERWQAVIDRDRAADAAFVFSVRSTGVYCRPSCPARRPKRENVCFHGTCAEAEQAGFRPCKRCKPNEATLAECNATAIAQACRAIEAADAPPRLDEMAENAGMSRFHFHRVFKEITGVTPKAYADSQRRARVQGGLARSATTTTEAIYDAGFNSNGRFYDTSNALIGMTPTAYRAGGEGEAIRFAVGECGLGSILVAATDKGVCAILLGDDPDVLVHDLQDRFCQAQLTGGDARFEQWVARVVGFVDAPAWELNLPLDIRGTAFQQQVWQALQDIPPGATANYAEIARRIGRPKSARAVARACCANPLAVAIPCHRVIRGDGGLAGYRWGIARKRALLEREAMASE